MTKTPEDRPKKTVPQTREERLKAALRDNLRRRKAQAKKRAGGKTDPPKQ